MCVLGRASTLIGVLVSAPVWALEETFMGIFALDVAEPLYKGSSPVRVKVPSCAIYLGDVAILAL